MKPSTKAARVLLADDHPILVEGLKQVLRGNFEVIDCASSGAELISLAARHKPEVIVADIGMPDMDGIEAIRLIRAQGIKSKVVFLTMQGDTTIAVRALRSMGDSVGYVIKSSAGEELVIAINEVLAGRTYMTPRITNEVLRACWHNQKADRLVPGLTPRQIEVLTLIAQGKTMKEVAAALDVSTRTAEAHKYQIMQQLGVKTIAQLVQFAIQHGVIKLPASPISGSATGASRLS